jgi:hypothetical protein
VFDGTNYRKLQQSYVMINGKRQSYKFFSDPRDIALGASTDGFAPFKRRNKTCWPLILFNYNLPPEIRFLIQYILCIGVIPGPNKPKDFDSFLWPAVQEFLKLKLGVSAFDATTKSLFPLRAYLFLLFGDIPAVSMVMRMKGHNGLVPCRTCNIQGVRVPGSRGTTHYVPLDRSNHPDIADTPDSPASYDASSLPLRSHAQFLQQAHEVQFAATTAEEERLAKKYGIKGIPILSNLSSLFFPHSFPWDFMHLIFENVIKNLTLLWTGEYKGMDEGNGSYQLNPTVWEALGAAAAASGSTIPSAFGARPPNAASDKKARTAETWSFWMLYLGPVLLHRKFERPVYYDHYVELVKLVHLCLQFEISQDDIASIREGFQKWVVEYEKYIFHYKISMISKLII